MAVRCLDVTVGSTSALKENRFSAKQDPYAVITLGDQEHRTTASAYERTRPVWNHRVSFVLPSDNEEGSGADELVVDIFEHGTPKDKHIGHCKIPLANVKEKGSVDVVQPVYRKSGKLLGHLRFHLAILTQQAVRAENTGFQKTSSRIHRDAVGKLRKESSLEARTHTSGHEVTNDVGTVWTSNLNDGGTVWTSNLKGNSSKGSGGSHSNNKARQDAPMVMYGHPGLNPLVQNISCPNPAVALRPGRSVSLGGGIGDANGLTLFPLKQSDDMDSGGSSVQEKRMQEAEVSAEAHVGWQAGLSFGVGGGGRQREASMAQEQEGPIPSPSAYVIPISYWQHLHPVARQGFAPYWQDTNGKYSSGASASDFSEQGQQCKERSPEGGDGKDSGGGGERVGRKSLRPEVNPVVYVGGKRKANAETENDTRLDYICPQMPMLSGSLVQHGSDEGQLPSRWQERVFFG